MAEDNLLYIGLIDLRKEQVLACFPRSAMRGTGLLVDEGLEHVYEHATKEDASSSMQQIQLENITVYYKTEDDKKLAILVMVYTEGYPERLVQSMIQEIWKTVSLLGQKGGVVNYKSKTIQLPLSAQLARTFKRYNKAYETDNVLKVSEWRNYVHSAQTQIKVQDATQAVQESMQQIMDSCANMQQLQTMSQALKTKTIVLQNHATSMATYFGKMIIWYISYAVVVFLVIALYISLPIVLAERK
ncbi:septum site-determining protein [Babesia ovata]|uniref:Septum site-determining protein n=1 Tax=Babesia ovata TaxID=189622 RepID=A0A2H6KGJ9_9APIC|nr:septum site-determining protein [Babesia ovata]GBE62116.1 septum site-determining protein [Babesia ovata]